MVHCLPLKRTLAMALRPHRPVGIDLLAVALILLTATDAWLSRFVLNPDGVSYLDLAARLSAGDWGAFVQGYWSPLYPALIALLPAVTGHTPAVLLTGVHLMNGVAVIGAVVIVWTWCRRSGDPRFGVAALASLFLVSSLLPRVEAVTPDALLLALMTWLGYELLVERGTRWARIGALSGVLYLVKTSSWPWLLLSFPLRYWGARDAGARRDVVRSFLVALPVILLWVVPVSIKAGYPTFGSTARLNFCWYLEGCDSRTPDEHLGDHVAYRHLSIDGGATITWAEFDAERWTYEPWSDPTGWEAGVLTRNKWVLRPAGPFLYWGMQSGMVFANWLLPVLAGVLLPWCLFEGRAERRRWWIGEGRPVLVVALLGLAGIVQFILVNAEPRLIAPYAMLLALALLFGASPPPTRAGRVLRHLAGWLGLLQVAWYGSIKLREGIDTDHRLVRVLAAVASSDSAVHALGRSQARIVVLGPGIPAEGGAYFSGAHIVAQLLPASTTLLETFAPEVQEELLRKVFGGKAEIAWRSTPNGTITFIPIPPPSPRAHDPTERRDTAPPSPAPAPPLASP